MEQYQEQEYIIQRGLLPEHKKHEYVELQDRFYFCRHQIQALERELEEKEFKCRCMPQTKAYYDEQIGKDGQVLVCSGIIAIAFIMALFNCIFNPSGGAALMLLIITASGARQLVQSIQLLHNMLNNLRIKNGLDGQELDMRTRMYDIKIKLEELGQERSKLEKEIKLQERIREIEGKLYQESEHMEEVNK